MNKSQHVMGIFLLISLLLCSYLFLDSESLHLRLVFGLLLGYTLTRGFLGFAGSVNRAYKTGSTKLMQVLMVLFILTALFNSVLLLSSNGSVYNMWVNPINLGLLGGAMLFGFGMSFSGCCASGVMTNLLTDIPRGATTLFFFCFGVYLGYPLKATQSWISDSVISTPQSNGVFLPDLFPFSPSINILSAFVMTLSFAMVVIFFARKYEQKRKERGSYSGVANESAYKNNKNFLTNKMSPIAAMNFYKWLMLSPWSMLTSAFFIAMIFAAMLITTNNGWGASGVFGLWFGKILIAIGISVEQVAEFSNKPASAFTQSILLHPISLQNIGIMFGALICTLLMGKLQWQTSYSIKQVALFALGGLSMGLGTRLASGCNVGALYTPIANFSLSGWIFLICLIFGGVVGNKLALRLN